MDNLFVRNRLKLLNIFHEGDFAILFAGEAPQKRGDEKYRFSPDRNFYYLSGIDRERCILVIAKIKGCIIERLYIEESNGQMAKWVGENITKEYAQEISAINDVRFLKEFEIDFEANKKNIDRLFLDGERKDLLQNQMPEGYKQKYKISQFEDLFPILTDFRLVKEPEELNLMKEAMEITRLAIEEMMKNAKPNMKEYEIEAYYDFILTKNGVRDKAFQTIAASGENATVLHYIENNSTAKDNDLILIDAGAQVGWYNGDISRTFPVNGKFTEQQKLVYNIVLGGQKLVMEAVRPGTSLNKLNELLKDYYYKELKKIGLVNTKEDTFDYYYHSVGHFLGAETHDVGDRQIPLKPNMVITIEPGLYIKEWGIGIRIEDDVLVTENGFENLTKNMIKTVEEIESFMKG